MAIYWKDEYSIGISVIDEQHKKFIVILNELSASFLKKSKNNSLRKIVDELEKYAHWHFDFEEKYFKEFHYKDAEAHEKSHTAFCLQVQKMKERLEQEDDLLEYDMFLFANDWLIVHIQEEDRKYAQCFLEHGMQ